MGRRVLAIGAAAVEDAMNEAEELYADELTSTFNVPPEEIRSRIKREDVEWKSRLVVGGSLYVSSKPVPLRKFTPVQSKLGVMYRKYRGGGQTLVRHAFGPNIPRLGRGVWARTGKSRVPIEKVDGVVIPEDRAAAEVAKRVSQRIPEILDRRMKFYSFALVHEDHSVVRKFKGPLRLKRSELLKNPLSVFKTAGTGSITSTS